MTALGRRRCFGQWRRASARAGLGEVTTADLEVAVLGQQPLADLLEDAPETCGLWAMKVAGAHRIRSPQLDGTARAPEIWASRHYRSAINLEYLQFNYQFRSVLDLSD
jgi:hypothetical protein